MITPFDLAQAVALSTEAGWNQTPEDWTRLMELAPDGCFGAVAGGRLASTTVALTYERRLAWIGVVLTTAAERGKGHARTLMQKALRHLDETGVSCIKLDATPLGRPVYAKLGFLDERPVSRWLRQPAPFEEKAVEISASIDFAFDREAFGVDRSALLRKLARREVYSLPRGFAFARPGRVAWQFGPCVARNAETAEQLMAAFLSRHAAEPSVLDLCDEHENAGEIALRAGYEPVRNLMRMYKGDPAGIGLASGDPIYFQAGFEYG